MGDESVVEVEFDQPTRIVLHSDEERERLEVDDLRQRNARWHCALDVLDRVAGDLTHDSSIGNFGWVLESERATHQRVLELLTEARAIIKTCMSQHNLVIEGAKSPARPWTHGPTGPVPWRHTRPVSGSTAEM